MDGRGGVWSSIKLIYDPKGIVAHGKWTSTKTRCQLKRLVDLLAVVCASIYPMFDRRTFSGLIVVLLAWPWIDYLPSAWLPLAIVLNTIIIFGLLAILSLAPMLLRRMQK